MSEKKKRERKPRAPKPPVSEMELAQKQAARMLKDMTRLQATQKLTADQKATRTNVDQWKDTDFFFSFCFQSSRQKYEALEFLSKKFGLGFDNARAGDTVIQVINGLAFMKVVFGLIITAEKMGEFPYPDLELAKLALDDAAY